MGLDFSPFFAFQVEREGTCFTSFGFYNLDKSFYVVKFRWQEVGVGASARDESRIASHEMKRYSLEELADISA